MVVYALYSPCSSKKGPKTKETFKKIGGEIINQQLLKDKTMQWVIVGDWNADVEKYENRFEDLARETGGTYLKPSVETFVHRATGAKRKLDLLVTNLEI